MITGATGFVGSNLARFLVNKGLSPHIFIREDSNLWRIKDILGKLRPHILDLTDEAVTRDAVTRFYRTEALRKINPQVRGIGFDFETVSKLCKYDYKIKEIAVSYYPRTKGKKIKVYDIIPAVWMMLKIKFNRKDQRLKKNG